MPPVLQSGNLDTPFPWSFLIYPTPTGGVLPVGGSYNGFLFSLIDNLEGVVGSNINITVQNTGSSAQDITVNFYANNPPTALLSGATVSLAAGASHTFSYDPTSLSPVVVEVFSADLGGPFSITDVTTSAPLSIFWTNFKGETETLP